MRGGLRPQVVPVSLAGGPDEMDTLAETRETRNRTHAWIREQNAAIDQLRALGLV